MTKEELYKIIDELKYNIKDGINIPGCTFRFDRATYEGALGALTMLEQRVEKFKENTNDR